MAESLFNVERLGEGWCVVGPGIAGGWDGTVPKSHEGMAKSAAWEMAALFERVYLAGVRSKQAELLKVLGLSTWGGDVRVLRG